MTLDILTRQVCANSVAPDKNAPPGLRCLLFCSFCTHDCAVKPDGLKFTIITPNLAGVEIFNFFLWFYITFNVLGTFLTVSDYEKSTIIILIIRTDRSGQSVDPDQTAPPEGAV